MLVNQVLPLLNLRIYSSILIRKRGKCGVEFVGGGDLEKVCRRFGNLKIDFVDIGKYVLFVYVK